MTTKERPPMVRCICAKCRKPIRIWGGYYMGAAEWRFGKWEAPVARMWGCLYTHNDCKER